MRIRPKVLIQRILRNKASSTQQALHALNNNRLRRPRQRARMGRGTVQVEYHAGAEHARTHITNQLQSMQAGFDVAIEGYLGGEAAVAGDAVESWKWRPSAVVENEVFAQRRSVGAVVAAEAAGNVVCLRGEVAG